MSEPHRTLTGLAPEVLADIGASPTPFHAVARARELLEPAGFAPVELREPFPSAPGRYLLAAGGLLAAWVQPDPAPPGFLVVGAHTDSPNLRVKSAPDLGVAGLVQVGVEVYGSPLLNSWLDRDLGLAGRVAVRCGGGLDQRLVRDDRPLLRVPQLAVHLDRELSEPTGQALRLNAQTHLTPLWALGPPEPGAVRAHVAGLLGVEAADVLAYDLMAHDTAAPAVVGRDGDLVGSARLDNQLSCFAGVHALLAVAGADLPRTALLCLYDHEEVGSQTATGAAGGLLASVLERISAAAGRDRSAHLAALASSLVVSADGAQGTSPNHLERYDPAHRVALGAGVVVKRNAKQRYATDSESEGFLRAVCADAGLALQTYVNRNDLPCGSTIGPITAAQLAVPTVDIGAPMLAMHSIRELAATADVDALAQVLAAAWTWR